MEHPLIIGICGGTGSGKTTVTERIKEKLDKERIVVIQHDSYYKDISGFDGLSPGDINFDHPHALETCLLIQHLQLLRQRVAILQPIYDFKTYRRLMETRIIPSRDVIIVEGILLFVEKELRDLFDVKIYVDTDADERLLRRLKRDLLERGRTIESVIEQYNHTVKPMHLEFVEPSKRWADVILPQGGENFVAIDMIVARINSMLRT
jgi:uridine kinase